MCRENKWVHMHPFEPFLPGEATHLIVGTLPPPRFSIGSLKKGDVFFVMGVSMVNCGPFWIAYTDSD